ncbi:MAG TPA: cytochrome c [Bradyrhizobium sp.]|uniref:cytochrome c n=1 Tax=Bradyrhizobium sp. TaxID=376 RepID=UPI002D7E2E05|nr:cytochrome c [Bradyrhizobium sp.]HET7889717.1 cytochrome c [Bradyrhizobium sp.]
MGQCSTRYWHHSAGAILIVAALCTASNTVRAQLPSPPSPETIAKGKALTEAGDCGSCHTADPSKPFAGGKRIDTPFGGIYSANLTPDLNTGIGRWTDEAFLRAMRYGERPDGAREYPAFPYPHFTKVTRQDIFAIRAYLATVAPVDNTPPPSALRWPWNHRALMRFWNFAFFRPGIFEPDQSKSAEWNRGGYLVEGLGHCGACHTPKSFFGAERQNARFAGSRIDGWFAPRLDGAERGGLKSWSVDDIAEYLQSGRNAHSHAGGPMAQVVLNSTSHLSDGDARAIAVYLKDIAASSPEAAVAPPSAAQMANGEKLYKGSCVACHELDGSGAPRIYPPLPGNANLQSSDPLSTIRIVLDGAETITTPRAPNKGSMPGYAKMSDQDVADVVTYIRNAWGNAAPAVTAADVAQARR